MLFTIGVNNENILVILVINLDTLMALADSYV